MKHIRKVDNPSNGDRFISSCDIVGVRNIKSRGISSKNPTGALSDQLGQRG